MIVFIDLDGTLCTEVEGDDYRLAQPKQEEIDHVNDMWKLHHITIWTARGSTTGKDWKALTIEQLKKWGVKYDKLNIGNKPFYDLYIGDKCKNVEDWK